MASLLAALVPCAVMLVPGAFGGGTTSLFLKQAEYFAEYVSYFEARGCRVAKAEFAADATIEVRALTLRDQLSRFAGRPGETLWLVAHSQGALDARFALKTLRAPGVDALVAIGAPQAGTPIADWVVHEREREGFWYWALKFFGRYDLKALSFAAEMQPGFLLKHAAKFEKAPGVRYASVRAVCRDGCSRSLAFLDWLTGTPELGEGRGDGIVSRESQAWGDDLGEFNLDHLSEAGADPLYHDERRKLLDRLWAYLSHESPVVTH